MGTSSGIGAVASSAEDDEDAAGRDQMMSLGVQSLSTSLAASGGLGIGKMVAKAMHAAADRGKTAISASGTATDTLATVAVFGKK